MVSWNDIKNKIDFWDETKGDVPYSYYKMENGKLIFAHKNISGEMKQYTGEKRSLDDINKGLMEDLDNENQEDSAQTVHIK